MLSTLSGRLSLRPTVRNGWFFCFNVEILTGPLLIREDQGQGF